MRDALRTSEAASTRAWTAVIAALAAALLIGAAAVPVAAQEVVSGLPALTPEQTRVANEAMSQLRSPDTPFHTVDMCPSAGALRDSIRVAAASGLSTEEIVEGVIAHHGEKVRLLPKRSGRSLWAWIAPPAVLVLGAGVIVLRNRHLRSTASPDRDRSDPGLSPDERGEIDAALREWENQG